MATRLSTSIAITITTLFLTYILQVIGLHQLITGILINTIFVALQYGIDWKVAVIAGSLTPIYAIFTGHLPDFLLRLIPFIIFGNAIMIVLGHFWEKKNIIERILLPPLHKAAVIGLGGMYIYAYHDYPEAHNPTFLRIIALQYATAMLGSALGIALATKVLQPIFRSRRAPHKKKA